MQRQCIDAFKWLIQMILREGRKAVITFIVYIAASDAESELFPDEARAEVGDDGKV